MTELCNLQGSFVFMNNLASQSGVNICLYEHVNFFIQWFSFTFLIRQKQEFRHLTGVYNAEKKQKDTVLALS